MNGEPGAVQGADATVPNLIQRVVMVFMSPTKLGELLRQRSPWFWTLAIVGIVSLVGFLVLPADLFRAAVEEQLSRQPDQAQDIDTAMRFARIAGTAGALIGTFVAAAVIAGIVYLVFNVMLGGETNYRQHLSAVSHMYWINMLGFLLLIPLWIAKQNMQVRLGLGLLLPDAPSSFFGHLMNGIGIFGLWSSAALGAMESGLSGGKISVGKGITTVLVMYFVWVVISAAWATIVG